MACVKNILKYPGSKWNIAWWIASHFPAGYEDMLYVEPFFGSGAVFFTKERSKIETINDLDDDVVNLFLVARDYPEELIKKIELTPWSRSEYAKSYERDTCDKVENARRFLVRMWQGIGAKSSDKTGWRKNVMGVNGNVPRFHTSLPDCVLNVCERLKHSTGNKIVQIENRDAFELMKRHNTPDTLIYADPPYVRNTRTARTYKHEFTDGDHAELIKILKSHVGKVVLSGYDSELYSNELSDWFRYETIARTEAAGNKIEVIWCNYESYQQLKMNGV